MQRETTLTSFEELYTYCTAESAAPRSTANCTGITSIEPRVIPMITADSLLAFQTSRMPLTSIAETPTTMRIPASTVSGTSSTAGRAEPG